MSPYSAKTQRFLRWAIFLVVVVPALLFVVLSLFAPSDILDRWAWAERLTFVAKATTERIVPWIDVYRHARSTSFPQVATLTTALATLWWPLMSVGIFVLMALGHRQGRQGLRSSKTIPQLLFLAIAALPIGLLCFFVFFGMPGDPGFAAGLTSGSRWGYALMGITEVVFSSLLISSWPLFVLAFFDSILYRNHHA